MKAAQIVQSHTACRGSLTLPPPALFGGREGRLDPPGSGGGGGGPPKEGKGGGGGGGGGGPGILFRVEVCTLLRKIVECAASCRRKKMSLAGNCDRLTACTFAGPVRSPVLSSTGEYTHEKFFIKSHALTLGLTSIDLVVDEVEVVESLETSTAPDRGTRHFANMTRAVCYIYKADVRCERK